MAQAASNSTTLCSICLDEVSDTCGRSIVRLQCSHLFHLDCIGSAFNVSGIMQCPNCREIENGVWMRFENTSTEQDIDQGPDEDDQHFAQMQYHGGHWCPIHGRITELPSLGYQDITEIPAIFPGNHHQPGPPIITEISTSQIFLNRNNQVHPAAFTPTCDHVIGSNQTLVPSAIERAPQGYAGSLPNFELGGYEVILQHRRTPDGFRRWVPEAHVPSPPQQTVYRHNPQAAILVHHRVEEGVQTPPYEYLPENMDPYWAPHD